MHYCAHHCLTEKNKRYLQDAKAPLETAMDFAKQHWAMELAATVMDYKQVPASSWKVMRTLEQGLQHHHMANRSIWITNQDGIKAQKDEESTEIF
eukprot:10499135-Ditylum_brightwellii.AAC.1